MSSADRRRLNGHFSGGTPQAFRRFRCGALGRRPPARAPAMRTTSSVSVVSSSQRRTAGGVQRPAVPPLRSARAPYATRSPREDDEIAWIGSFRPAWSQLLTVLPLQILNRGWNGGPPPRKELRTADLHLGRSCLA